VLSVNVEVSVLNGGLEVSFAGTFMLLPNFLLNELELISIEGAVSDEVTKNLDSLGDITLEDLEAELRILSVGLAVVAGSHVLNGLSDLAL